MSTVIESSSPSTKEIPNQVEVSDAKRKLLSGQVKKVHTAAQRIVWGQMEQCHRELSSLPCVMQPFGSSIYIPVGSIDLDELERVCDDFWKYGPEIDALNVRKPAFWESNNMKLTLYKGPRQLCSLINMVTL